MFFSSNGHDPTAAPFFFFFKSKITLIRLPVGACPCIRCALPQRSHRMDLRLHSPCRTLSPLCPGRPHGCGFAPRLPPHPRHGQNGSPVAPALPPSPGVAEGRGRAPPARPHRGLPPPQRLGQAATGCGWRVFGGERNNNF